MAKGTYGWILLATAAGWRAGRRGWPGRPGVAMRCSSGRSTEPVIIFPAQEHDHGWPAARVSQVSTVRAQKPAWFTDTFQRRLPYSAIARNSKFPRPTVRSSVRITGPGSS